MTSEDGGLRFPATKSLRIEDLIRIYDGLVDDADSALEASQISGPLPKPAMPDGLESYIIWGDNHDPLPPEDLTDLPPLILGKLFSFMSNWTNYVQAELTRAECHQLIQDRHWKVLKSALTIYYKEEGFPANQVNDRVTVDPRFVEVDGALLRFKVFVKTAQGRYEGLKRTLNGISREQTRRADELEQEIHSERGGYAGGRGKTSPSESPRARNQPFGRR
jgi:hypothetical protein